MDEFSGGFVLAALPAWVRKQPMLENLGSGDRQALEDATHGFVVTYEAAALGDPDPDWKGQVSKSIQETKYEHGVLANFALWLSRPCPVHFIIVLHAPQFDSEPTVQQTVRCSSRLLCHPRDKDGRITAEDLILAIRLHGSLLAMTRDTALWTAVRATWAGLQMNIDSLRFVLDSPGGTVRTGGCARDHV